MNHISFAMIFAFIASPAFAGATAAANTTTVCKGTGSPVAKVLIFDPSDGDTSSGLSIALQMGLTPATFPANDIAKIAAPCERNEFVSGKLVYTLYGTDDALPYRWATTPSHPGETIFVATMP